MGYTITDQDLIHFVEETLPESGHNVDAIVDALRPHIQFGDVSPADYVPEGEEMENFDHTLDKKGLLIGLMLAGSDVDEDEYWRIVEAAG